MTLGSVWMIRKKNTNFYMPEKKYGVKGGYSHLEPEPNGGPYGPRMFRSRHAARTSLVLWCMVPVEGRSRSDFELVQFTLTEMEPSA